MTNIMIEYYLGRGFGAYLLIFVLFAGIYFAWSIVGRFVVNHFFEKDKSIVSNLKKQSKALTIAVICLIVLSTFQVVMSFIIMNPNIDELVISRNNNYLMEIDHNIFGVYPPLWFQQSDNAYKPILDIFVPFLIKIYYSLTIMLSITLFMLFFLRIRLCLQFILAFFLCSVFSMPFWYLFPSISPVIAYWDPILFQDIPSNMATALNMYSPLPQLEESMHNIINFRKEIRDTTLIVTTIPSMHIAWGFLMAYYLIALSRILIFVAIPIFVLNSLSTIVTMQHYAIDTVGGTLIAIFAIYITKLISNRSINVFDPIVLLVQDDVEITKKWMRKRIRS